MRTYTLPEPTPLERQLVRLVSGETKRREAWKTWPNGEAFVAVSDVRDSVCVIGRSHPPADNLWQTLLLVDTLRYTGATGITVVLPYYAYSRQDRAIEHGEPVATATVSRLLAAAGATRIITADVHSAATGDESPIPIENVSMIPAFAAAFRKVVARTEITVVSPDAGGRGRVVQFVEALGVPARVAWVEKKRNPRTGEVRMLGIDGDIGGTTAIMVDDMVDTGSTLVHAAALLRKKGFDTLHLCATHPIFSGAALQKIRRAGFEKILISDTVPVPSRLPRNISVFSAAEALARAVRD